LGKGPQDVSVGVIFILFGARSIADAAGGALRKAA
jgi:hypothetical protein